MLRPTTRPALMQAGEHDDRRAVLVVVEDGDVEPLVECSSISKHRGAEMSSRLIPPYVGAIRATASTSSSTVPVSMHTGTASTSAKCLNRTALPSMTGMAASGPMSPSPRTPCRR